MSNSATNNSIRDTKVREAIMAQLLSSVPESPFNDASFFEKADSIFNWIQTGEAKAVVKEPEPGDNPTGESTDAPGTAHKLAAATVVSLVCVPASYFVEESWNAWFWEALRECTPFTWGDNEHSLVKASVFANHCRDHVKFHSHSSEEWLDEMEALGDMLIDLEA